MNGDDKNYGTQIGWFQADHPASDLRCIRSLVMSWMRR